MRRLRKLIIFVLGVYGPLGPTVSVFLVAAPPLIVLGGCAELEAECRT